MTLLYVRGIKINTTNLVWSVLEADPAIKKAFSRGLINTSALAKYIIKETDSDASMDAVVMSIKRNIQDIGGGSEEKSLSVNEVIKDVKFRLKSKVGSVILAKDPSTFSLMSDVLNCIDYCGTETFRLVNGIQTIELIVDDRNLDKIASIFTKDKIIKVKKELGEISLALPPSVEYTVGVFSTIINELSVHNINIFKTITTLNEFFVYVDEEDLSKSYDLLFQLYRKRSRLAKKE